MKKLLSCLIVGVASLACIAPGALASTAHSAKAPLLKSLGYTPLKIESGQDFLQAHFTATIKLSAAAPSVHLLIQSTSAADVSEEIGPEASYGPGVHKVSFTNNALPHGTYKVTLYAYVSPPKGSSSESAKLVKSSDPATLVIGEANEETEAGTGKVTKI